MNFFNKKIKLISKRNYHTHFKYKNNYIYKRNFFLSWFYTIKLNENQKRQFIENRKILEEDLKIYNKTNLSNFIRFRNLFFIFGLYSVYISGKYIHVWFSISGVIQLIVAMILTLFILKKQRKFINNYDLSHCNPGSLIRSAVASKLTLTTLTSVAIACVLGVLNGLDDTYAKFSGESAITKFGKYTGMHKDAELPNNIDIVSNIDIELDKNIDRGLPKDEIRKD